MGHSIPNEHVLYFINTYIILPKVAHVADDPGPDKHGAYPKEDAAEIIICEYLKENCSF